MGRPAREATPDERREIHRLMRRMGEPGIAARMPKTPRRVIRRELAQSRVRQRPGSGWRPEEDLYLEEHASDTGGAAALARGLFNKFGVTRTPRCVDARLRTLTTMGPREHRLVLSVEQVTLVLGRSTPFVLAEIERRRLKAFHEGGKDSGGALRIVPSDLRAYVLADDTRADWQRCERTELIGLLTRQWGVGEDERKRASKAAQRARQVGAGPRVSRVLRQGVG